MQQLSRSGDDAEWKDVTQDSIAKLKQEIDLFDRLIAAYERALSV